MQVQHALEIISITTYNFNNDSGDNIKGSKVYALGSPRDPSVCKGRSVDVFNAPFEFFSQVNDLSKPVNCLLELTKKGTRIVRVA